MTVKRIRLGTRGSPLALKQTEMVRAALAERVPGIETEVVVIKTSGDWDASQGEMRLLERAGGKGQFAKEIEEALLEGRVDAGVHSMKDMESHLPEGLVINHMLPREDARDVLAFRDKAGVRGLADLPKGFVIGTCSVRRQAFILSRRPDLKIVPLRGNVQTRIDKLKSGEQGMGAIILAYAGLKRLGLGDAPRFVIEAGDMLPSAGQGAIGIEIHERNQELLAVFDQISCIKTVLRVKAERAALAALGGSCHAPIGAYAEDEHNGMRLRVLVAGLNGVEVFGENERREISGAAAAENFGRDVGERLKGRLPANIIKEAFIQ